MQGLLVYGRNDSSEMNNKPRGRSVASPEIVSILVVGADTQ